MDKITATPRELVHDGVRAARVAFEEGLKIIDDEFGEGFCKQNPELLAAFINASSHASTNAINHAILQDAASDISGSLSQIADAIT